MAVFYKLMQNTITNSKTNGKWYAHSAIVGTVGLKQMADVIQRNCSMKRSDVNAVLTELPEVMRDLMQQGYRVNVEGLGAFKFQVYSQGTDSVSEFNVQKHIKRVKVVFQPESEYDKASGTRAKYLTKGMSFADINSLAAKAALDQKAEEESGQQVEP
ncbi:MAG: DNA-binding protein [Prevotella sp.]|nr:DNA-binding protein [Prevotella sp.]